MRTLLILMVSAIALVVAGLFALPWLTPQDFARERLATAIARRGHFRLESVQNIRMQAFPRPGFEVENIVVRIAGASENASGLHAKHVFLGIAPLSLFSGRARVSEVKADQARILLGGRGKERFNSDNRLLLDSIDLAIEHSGFESDDPAKLTGVLKSLWLGEDVHVAATLGQAQPTKQLDVESAPFNFQATSQTLRLVIDGVLSRGRQSDLQGETRLDIILSGRNEPLRAASLQGDLAVASDRARFTGGTFSAPNVNGHIQIFRNARGFEAYVKDVSLYGGHGRGSVELLSPSSGGGLRANFNVSDVDALSFSQSVSSFDWVSGKLSLELRVNSPDNDITHILDHLKGAGRVTVDNGAIEGLDLPGIVADIRDGELHGWHRKQGRRTAFDRFDAPFRVNGGVASITGLQLNGPNIAATGEGTANLASHKLDLRLKARVDASDNNTASNNGDAANRNDGAESSDAASAETASLTVPLRIKGDWNHPKVQPDVSEALKDRKSLKKSIKLFGKSIEKLTGGQVKSRDLGKLIDGFLGKDKKRKKKSEGEGASAPSY